MRILCLKHVPFEGPAAIADWAAARGHILHCHPVYENRALPKLDSFDFLCVMGGPMNIYEYEAYPWLKGEKNFIRAAMDAGKYLIGICLGGQLIADVLGAPVTRSSQTEIGWYPIQRTPECPDYFPLPDCLRALHWHEDRFEIPGGAHRIAASEVCDHQGFLYGDRVLALQCHLETTPESLADLARACGDELKPSAFVMSAEQLNAEPTDTYTTMQQVLFKLLDRMTTGIDVIDWGRTNYEDAFIGQREHVDLRKKDCCPDALIFTEHDPVYTMGLRKGADQHLLWSDAACAENGISIIQSNRGGDITYHGPGQIVGYPILSLQHKKDLHAYLRDLEEVVIRTLAAYGLPADRREGKTGIWIDNARKICAIGVAVRSWITYHGFALNIDPNMEHFEGIIPCGITDGSVTSLAQELDRSVTPTEVKARLAVEFQRVFGNTTQKDG